MIALTLERTKQLLAEAVAERGEEYVYKNERGQDGTFGDCAYVHGSPSGGHSPGCIVGLVLHKAGVPLERLARHEGTPANRLVSELRSYGYLEAESGVGRPQGMVA